MGYHNNEGMYQKSIKDAQRFINDRARLEHAIFILLRDKGISEERISSVVSEVKKNNFSTLYQAINPTIGAPYDYPK
jgi:SOS response regulatory protein OraA/RecX